MSTGPGGYGGYGGDYGGGWPGATHEGPHQSSPPTWYERIIMWCAVMLVIAIGIFIIAVTILVTVMLVGGGHPVLGILFALTMVAIIGSWIRSK